ncbi:DUF3500 domain-containing protein [Leifsonia aquatica]|uniref:DUF3500 domain-containing protein n=1 Tax=Leifsonia aquatica TaxID=144185 RepID=UPI00384E97C6
MTRQDEDIDGFFSTARVSARDEAVVLGTEDYRDFLQRHDDPELAALRGLTYEKFTAVRQQNEFLAALLRDWDALYAEPFVGVTADGVVQEGLYRLQRGGSADDALVSAAERALSVLSDDQRRRVRYPVDAPDWRGWSNPEFVFHRNGLRLEDVADDQADAILDLVAASLSPEGYVRVREAMALNGLLGELTDLPNVMNERSYWFALFGTPSPAEPWGWQLYGHHVCVNFVTVGGRDVIAPAFIGGEPATTGDRPPLFDERERLAVRLASSLTPEQRAEAVVYESVLDPAMPEGRLHPADERHVGGAFRDNRVVPYEGIPAGRLSAEQVALLRAITADFLLLLRAPQHERTLAEFDAHLAETRFSWYGATDGSQPVYFRIQSPVILAEYDNHAGVWLNNRLPARFHVHTTLRMPNGNDYGTATIASWKADGRP